VSEPAMSLPELLARRAAEQPDGLAYRFLDYDVDVQGFAEELTWSEVHQRARLIGDHLREHGSRGDRVAIAAPHSLDYVLGFLGAIQAGFVAVPLPVPHPGALDERFAGVLRDCSPAALVTTSAAVAETVPYTGAHGLAVVEVDALDFGATPGVDAPAPDPHAAAYLQYTSGSTRAPAGVVVTHHNVISNLDQITNEYRHGVTENRHLVSWLPFYHDMGLILGVLIPIMVGRPAVLMTPMAFLQKPARWLQQLAMNTDTFTAGPNFAYDLSVRRVTDEDMAGLDLDGVVGMILGGERVHGATMRRFAERFAKFGLRESALRPSYGLAEATVHVASSAGERAPAVLTFDADRLAAGHLERARGDGVELVSCGAAGSCAVRIVDPDRLIEQPAGAVGEIWVHGDQVGAGYWRNPELTERTFRGRLANPSPGTPPGPWLRTGDLGAMFDDELFVIGRIKDLLIVDGRNHYPDDIEATVEDITNSRAVAVAVPTDTTETLVAIAEVKTPGGSPELRDVKRQIAAAISACHGLRVSDLVLVAPGSLPITTSGKVRRSACQQLYRDGGFIRLDAAV
jgi:long chain fatty acid CoA FadD26